MERQCENVEFTYIVDVENDIVGIDGQTISIGKFKQMIEFFNAVTYKETFTANPVEYQSPKQFETGDSGISKGKIFYPYDYNTYYGAGVLVNFEGKLYEATKDSISSPPEERIDIGNGVNACKGSEYWKLYIDVEEWNSNDNYHKGNVVSFDGKRFVATCNCLGVQPFGIMEIDIDGSARCVYSECWKEIIA